MKLGVLCAWLLLSTIFINVCSVSALSYPKGSVGQDISWPNCDHLKFKPAIFGVVGVNGGLSFHSNACIGQEASLYKRNLSLYVNTGFPGAPYDLKYQSSPMQCSPTNNYCLAYNYGYNAGKYVANYSLSRGVVSNNWWLDVEAVNSWSNNPQYNIASLRGEVNAINESLKPEVIGFYSYPPEWTSLTDNWQNNNPNWLATNSNFKKIAEKQCNGNSFSNSDILLTQYIGSTDLDLSCK